MRFPFFIITILLVISGNLASQESFTVNILHSDYAELDASGVESIKKLMGHVHLLNQSTYIDCDTAIVYENNNIDAVGHVKIWKKDGTSVTGHKLNYYSSQRLAIINTGVVLTNGKAKLYTKEVRYELDPDIGYYDNGGRLVNEETTVTSQKGKYESNLNQATFYQNVRLVNPDYTLTSDTLVYDTKNKRTKFSYKTDIINDTGFIKCNSGWHDESNNTSSFGYQTIINNTPQWLMTDSIYIDHKSGDNYIYKSFLYRDSSQKLQIFGDSAYMNNKTNSFMAYKRPLLILEEEEKKNNTFIKADILKSRSNSENRELEALNNVRVYSETFQSMSDYLFYSTSDSILRMEKNPYLWYDINQISGDTIYIYLKNKKPREILSLQNALLVQQETPYDFNQISGDTVDIFLIDGKLDVLYSKNNAKSIYYAKEDGKEGYLGLNNSECSNLKVQFDSSKVDKIIFYVQPKATFYPIKDITQSNKFLPKFVWKDEERPKSKDDL